MADYVDRLRQKPNYATAVVATDGANATLVTITLHVDGGTAVRGEFGIRLSDAATGIGLTATAASGAVTDKTAGTTGQVLSALVAKKALLVQTAAAGTYGLSITDTAKTPYVIAVVLDGMVLPVATLATASYG